MNIRLKMCSLFVLVNIFCINTNPLVISREKSDKIASVAGTVCGIGICAVYGNTLADQLELGWLSRRIFLKVVLGAVSRKYCVRAISWVLDFYSPEYLLYCVESSLTEIDDTGLDMSEKRESLMKSLGVLEEIESYINQVMLKGGKAYTAQGYYYKVLADRILALSAQIEQKLASLPI